MKYASVSIGFVLCAVFVLLGLRGMNALLNNKQTEVIDADAARIASLLLDSQVENARPAIGPTYQNQKFHFSIQHPDSIQPLEVFEEGTLTVAFQTKQSEPGFQVFAVPYNAPEISEERFRADVPTGVRTEPINIEIAGVRAVKFYSESDIGGTVEIWFIHKGILYEVTTYRELESWLLDILKTWAFIP